MSPTFSEEASLYQVVGDSSYSNLSTNNESWLDETNAVLPGVTLPSLCLILLLVISCICINFFSEPPVIEADISSPLPEPQVKSNIILCDSEKIQFEYLMIIRVGSSTTEFMKNSWMDVDIIGMNGEVLGKPVR